MSTAPAEHAELPPAPVVAGATLDGTASTLR